MKLILIYFVEASVSEIFLFPHVVNIQITDEIFYFFFFSCCLWNLVHSLHLQDITILTSHISSAQ